MPRYRSHPLHVVFALLLLPLAAARLGASPGIATIERITVGNGPMEPNGGCFEAREGISADGRFVVFASWASNLVRGDRNETGDIFVSDRQTGATERMSVAADGAEGTIESSSPTISADGRYVAFVSVNAFVTGDANGYADVYVKDRVSGSIDLVSLSAAGIQANADCVSPSISGDGRYVAFETQAQNLVAGDNENYPDVYVRDRQTNTIKRASGTGNPNSSGQGAAPTLSPDGRFVAFTSRGSNLVPGDFNSIPDVFVRDLQTDAIERVSVSTDGSVSGSTDDAPAISDDGRFVAFGSGASLVPGDSNSAIGVFVRDRLSGTTERISRSASGVPANGESHYPGISGDGRYVVFESGATNLIDGQTNFVDEIYLQGRSTGSIQLLSFPRPVLSFGFSDVTPAISGNGRFITFAERDEVPGDYNHYDDIFVRDRVSMSLTRASNAFDDPLQPDGQSTAEGISADGRFVAFSSWATNLVPGDTDRFMDVFVRDRQLGVTELVSRDTSGAPASGFLCRITPDARHVVFTSFTSFATLVAQDINGFNDVYLRDRLTGSLELISISSSGSIGDGNSTVGMISDDGRYVAFRSSATNLVSGDTNGVGDVFVRDRVAGTTERVSVGPSLVQANAECSHGAFSGTGRFISFTSRASNLVTGDTNSQDDVFLRDRVAGTTERLSVATNGTQSNASSGGGAISLDGRYFVFSSAATNLIAGDTNGQSDVFLRDRTAGTTERVSVSSSGQQADLGVGGTVITPDGRRVFFSSAATNLVPSDTNGRSDFFVRDLQAGTTERINLTSSGAQSTGPVSGVIRSTPDFRFMAFATTAADLLGPGNDENGVQDIYLLRNYTGAAPVASAAAVNTQEDTAVPVNLQASDTDSDALTYIIVSPPQHGTLSGSGAARTYTPAADYNGPDSFTFKAYDGACDSNIAAVSITVNPVNDAPVAVSDGYSATEDTPLTVTAGMGVLANDTDVEGQPLTAVLGVGPDNGDLTLNADGSFTYTPQANYHGADSFTYKASDGATESAPTVVALTVVSVNDPPSAQNLSFTLNEDSQQPIDLLGTDADGDSLTFQLLSGPDHGVLSGSGAARTYSPAANYAGPDQFTYRVSDGLAESGAATVTLTVTPVADAPIASGQSVSTPEDTARSITLAATDADGGALTYTIVGAPQHGGLSGTGANRTYQPNANFNGADSFTFRASDGQIQSNLATVNITVTPVNDPPTALGQAVSVTEDIAKTITLSATDADGDSLTYSIVTTTTQGVLSGSGAARTYTPAANFNGTDSFTFLVNDGQVNSGPATVSLTVSAVADFTVANGDSYAVDEDTTLTIPAAGVLANDLNPDGGALTLTVVTQPRHGAVTLNQDGSFTYVPASNYAGVDEFRYELRNSRGETSSAGVFLTIRSVNDPPTAQSVTVTGDEDTDLSVPLLAGDADGDSITYTVVTGPEHGTLSGAGGTRTYRPAANFAGTDSLTFKTSDGKAESALATVTLSVNPVNDPPAAASQSTSTAEDTPRSITLAGSDPDGDALTYQIVSGPQRGALSGSGAALTYTPAANFNGSDQFTFRVSDGSAQSASATVSIAVSPVNDPPVAHAGTPQTVEAAGVMTPVLLDGSASTDPDGNPLTYEWRLGETAIGSGSRPNVSLPLGSHDLVLAVTDTQGQQSTAQVRVTIQDTTPPQLSLPNTLTVPPTSLEGAQVTFQVTATDTLPGVTVTTTPASGSLFPLGATTVQCLARDAAGNEASGTFQVLVSLHAPPAARVTASGAIPVTGGAGKLKLSVQSVAGRPLKGILSFKDPVTRKTIKSTALTGLVIDGNRARVFGRASLDRGVTVDFMAEAEDLGTIRGADRFRLELSDGRAWGSAALSSGAVKIVR